MRLPVTGRPPEGSGIAAYTHWLAAEHGFEFPDHEALWRWSVEKPADFWKSVADHFGVRGTTGPALGKRTMPGAEWFPDARLNYAEHALGLPEDRDKLAVIARSQTRAPSELTYGRLAELVARARAGLRRLGVGRGDRVVAYLPTIPETLVAFLATASLGAVWASCAPEFGARSVVDRFAQLEPQVLIAIGGYRYGDKSVDKSADLATIRAGLPTLRHVVGVPYGEHVPTGTSTWDDLLAVNEPLEFESLSFDHPLHVLFSSGTTGLPKAIVHGHGGILLEHLKLHGLNLDTRPGDRVLWFTTTAWTMWNILISGLLRRAAVVLVDGDPQYPSPDAQWRLAAETRATLLGTSPAYLTACRRSGGGLSDLDLSALRTLGVTGAPLTPEAFYWANDQLGAGVLINSISGGTDVCSAFVAGNPWLPTVAGEIAAPCLGADTAAFDDYGREVVGCVGELVVRAAMPSMPLRFWNDPGDARYRAAYFDTYPGVWRHGDSVTFTDRRSCIISGRSDATLNRGGVRMGTAEFYSVVEEMPEIADSIVVHLEDAGGGPGELLLFVALRSGTRLDDDLRVRIGKTVRSQLSPRHVPSEIVQLPAVPRTLTGKKLETPVKQILLGRSASELVTSGTVAGYAGITAVAELARRRATASAPEDA
ncbi:acetoacetate--CoA ligase [Amycolatopsis sp. NPDC047767]|uniref:acetoacetate--CoA ligase n=1 Tax=Amycolatopsis sp. NPDC047767 TaxID=3156765 RepID=UPI00345499B8